MTFPASDQSSEYQQVYRIDWVRTPKNTIFGRYFILDYGNPAVYTGNLLTLTRPGLLDRSQSVVLGDQMTLSPTLINSIHFTYGRLAIHRSNPANMPSPTQEGINIYDASPNFSYIKISNYFPLVEDPTQPSSSETSIKWSDRHGLDQKPNITSTRMLKISSTRIVSEQRLRFERSVRIQRQPDERCTCGLHDGKSRFVLQIQANS